MNCHWLTLTLTLTLTMDAPPLAAKWLAVVPPGLDLAAHGNPYRHVAYYQIVHNGRLLLQLQNYVLNFYRTLPPTMTHRQRLWLAWYMVTGFSRYDFYHITHAQRRAAWIKRRVDEQMRFPDSVLPETPFNVPSRIDRIQ